MSTSGSASLNLSTPLSPSLSKARSLRYTMEMGILVLPSRDRASRRVHANFSLSYRAPPSPSAPSSRPS